MKTTTRPRNEVTIDRWLSEMKIAAARGDGATVLELVRRVAGLMMIHQWVAAMQDDEASDE